MAINWAMVTRGQVMAHSEIVGELEDPESIRLPQPGSSGIVQGLPGFGLAFARQPVLPASSLPNSMG
jgi:hypothetical protein